MSNSANISGDSGADAPLLDRRAGIDRRETSTRFFSRYWLLGRRKLGRRTGEDDNIYVDRYTHGEWFLVAGILLLSVLDMVFTILHLNAGGTEANPVMAWTLAWGGQHAFKIIKLVTTLAGLFVLLVHVRFRRVRTLLALAFAVYASVFVFHLYLVWLRGGPDLIG
ncbi:MAG: DUF5658 family protein [Planctomycetota bacterium]|jgi:hypothetical protein